MTWQSDEHVCLRLFTLNYKLTVILRRDYKMRTLCQKSVPEKQPGCMIWRHHDPTGNSGISIGLNHRRESTPEPFHLTEKEFHVIRRY